MVRIFGRGEPGALQQGGGRGVGGLVAKRRMRCSILGGTGMGRGADREPQTGAGRESRGLKKTSTDKRMLK